MARRRTPCLRRVRSLRDTTRCVRLPVLPHLLTRFASRASSTGLAEIAASLLSNEDGENCPGMDAGVPGRTVGD